MEKRESYFPLPLVLLYYESTKNTLGKGYRQEGDKDRTMREYEEVVFMFPVSFHEIHTLTRNLVCFYFLFQNANCAFPLFSHFRYLFLQVTLCDVQISQGVLWLSHDCCFQTQEFQVSTRVHKQHHPGVMITRKSQRHGFAAMCVSFPSPGVSPCVPWSFSS